jgi:hypothetical protein
MIKLLIVFVTPIAMVIGFVDVLGREIGHAFRYAWLEAMGEWESAKRAWRR